LPAFEAKIKKSGFIVLDYNGFLGSEDVTGISSGKQKKKERILSTI